MDAQISTTIAIALARALSTGASGSAGPANRTGPTYAEVNAAWVGPRMPSGNVKPVDDARDARAEPGASDLIADPESFVAGTLGMVAFARTHTQDLVEYPADRDTVL
jgi:hypothetical protein